MVTLEGEYHAPVSLPQEEGESLPLESGGEDYTLLNFGLKLFVTEEAYFLGACERQYQFSETGSQLTGLLLRYTPGLSAIDLTFVDPVYRWNHPFQVPVIIPE